MKRNFYLKIKLLAQVCIVAIALLSFAAIAQAQTCASPPNGLVSWWAGDGNSLDNRGANHATIMNGASFSAGTVNQAFSFNGASQYLSIPQSANLPIRGTNDFTIDAWVNHQGDDSPSVFNLFAYRNGGDDVQFIITRTEVVVWGTTAYGVILRIAHGVNPATWNHYAITRNGNVWRVYVNGNQIGSDVTSSVNLLTPGTTQNIGTTGGAETQFAIGMIDEVSIYNRALSQTEIQSIFNAGSAGKCRSCISAPSGLVSWWSAENNALDTRLLNHGSLRNGVTFTNGKVGQAFSFNGTGAEIRVPASASLDVGTGNGFTIETWVYPASLYQMPLVEWDQFGANLWIGGNFSNGTLSANIKDLSGTAHIIQTPVTVVATGVWQHAALTYDKSTGMATLYLDGNVVAGPENLGSFTPKTWSDMYIGSRPFNNYYNGQLDEVGIYNRALSASEIQSIVVAGNAGKCAQCVPAKVGLISTYTAENNALDARSRNNGNLPNGAVYGAGKVGQAFGFNGLNQHVEIPDDPSLRPTNGMTVEGWFKFNSSVPNGALISKPLSSASNNSYVIWTQAGGLAAGINVGIVSTAFSPTPGEWYHIAYTYDEATFQNRLLVNGEVVDSRIFNADPIYDSEAVLIGMDKDFGVPTLALDGFADETSIYNRALSVAEVQAIVVAGQSGMCKPTATVAPTGLIGWWAGDGWSSDISGLGNNGTLENGASYAIGKSGQAFSFDGINDSIVVPDSSALNVTTHFTLEAWINPASLQSDPDPNSRGGIISKVGGAGGDNGYQFGITSNNNEVYCQFNAAGEPWAANKVTAALSSAIPINTWTHLACIYDNSNLIIYMNGNPVATQPIGAKSAINTSSNLRISGDDNNSVHFHGLIDEAAIYNRALAQDEIQSIYNAGIAGKLKSTTTPTGFTSIGRKVKKTLSPELVNTTIGETTISFQSVTTAGETQQIPLNRTLFPALPAGAHTGLFYDIATTAVYSGNVDVCFNLPYVTTASKFPNLRVMHFENGAWQDRTSTSDFATRTLCSQVSSLSPFAIADLAPTAASVSISGQVMTAEGRMLGRATITITDQSGNSRTTITSPFGYYRFDDVEVGETYVFTVTRKGYRFAPQMVTVTDENNGLNFFATQ